MAVAGSTAEPNTGTEWFGLNVTNQIANVVVLPAGGPWRIYKLGAWLAGYGATCPYKLCLWTGGGTLVRSSGALSVATQALGTLSNAEATVSDYVVAGGTSVIVGFWRDPAKNCQNGWAASGSHYHDTAGTSPESFGAFGTHGGTAGGYLYYDLSNTAPSKPTISSPTQNQVVNDTTPLIDWAFSDPDGDAQESFQVQHDTDGNFGSPVSSGTINSATSSYTLPALVRGATYAVRVSVKDPGDLWSGWGPSRTFKVASLPTVSVSSPVANAAMPLYYAAGSDTVPKLNVAWAFACADGGAQSSASIKVYNEADVLQHTHAHTGSATSAQISGFTPVNGTKYKVAVIVVCSHGATSSESAKMLARVRWGRASYRADLLVVPITLSATVDSTTNSGQVIVEFASSAATTPEPTDWKASIAEVAKLRYVWHRVTLIPQPVAAPTSPALNSVTFSYSANVLTTDGWTLDPQFSVDQGTFVYGTQSVRHTGDGTNNVGWQSVEVQPNTDYVFSGRIKSQGAALASLMVRESGGGVSIVSVNAVTDVDWTRYSTPVFNSGARTAVEVCIVGAGAAATSAWFDALKLEASTVVTPWSPGFLGAAVTIDSGGVMVDAQAGGIFRLRGSTGGTRDTVEVGTRGLRLGGDAEMFSDIAGAIGVPTVGRFVYKGNALSIAASTWTPITAYQSTYFTGRGVTYNANGGSELRADVAGVYLLVGHLTYSAQTGGDRRILSFGVAASNGIVATPSAPGRSTDFGESTQFKGAATFGLNISSIAVAFLNVDDCVRLFAHQNHSAAINCDRAEFGIFRLGLL